MIETPCMQVLKSRELSVLALRCCLMTFLAFVLVERKRQEDRGKRL